MLNSQHVFSHQHQYHQTEPSWLHQHQAHHQQQHTHQAAQQQQHAQAQAAAAAAAAAQQQHYNRIAANNNSNGPGINGDHGMGAGTLDVMSEENRRVLGWVAELMNGNSREAALMELSKKREQVPELALIIWHSFGVMTSLLQEIISVYPLLNPSQLTAAASNRVCNALALLQCVASHNETRGLFLSAHIPLFLYPFLNTTSKSRPFEYLRLTSLGVIGALVKNDSSEVINFLLTTEIIPLCLRIMETGSELSKTVAIFIVQKILLDDLGLGYICHTYERFYAVGTVLSNMVTQLVEQQTVRLLKHVVRCFLRLSDNARAREALRQCLPEPLRDATFSSVLRDDAATKRCLAQLLINLSDNVVDTANNAGMIALPRASSNMSRKRGRAEMEASQPPPELGLLDRLRNMWQFSNLMQYIFIFGKAVKIDEDFDIEDLETECVKPGPSEKLSEIGLALLKFVSSHRGLTPDIFDEYTRRQFVAKAPARNPFGTEETPNKFAEFDIFTKIRVLFQLSQWTLINADRMRERMPETKDTEQTQWPVVYDEQPVNVWLVQRVEDIGMDKENRLYYVLDDNRLYRRTDPPSPPPPPNTKAKGKSKKAKAGARASKRRKVVETDESADNAEGATDGDCHGDGAPDDDGFGGCKWDCVAITLDQYREFLESIRRSKNRGEKDLHARITDDVLPIIEKAEEAQQRKIARRERELMTLQKLATAKRSGRIASKMDKEREEREAAESERKRQVDLVEAKKEQERQKKMEEARESRMMTREQRLKEREYKRILQEEELANLSEDSRKLETGEARMSERHLKAEMEKRKKELDKLAQEDEWFFDCSKCGVHGENLVSINSALGRRICETDRLQDDGSHSVACEKCNVWQHSACLGISQADAEKDDFHFVCDDCKRREEDAKKPKIPALKFRIGSSSSPPSDKTIRVNGGGSEIRIRKAEDGHPHLPPVKKFSHVHVQAHHVNHPTHGQPPSALDGMHGGLMNGPTLSPHGQLPLPPHSNGHVTQSAPPPPGLASPPRPASYTNGYAQHVPQPNGYASRSYPQPNPSLPNTPLGATHTSHGSPGSVLHAQHPPILSVQSPQNPFLNSFDRQRPSSSHSTHNLPSPMKNRPSMSPTQGNLETSAIVNPANQPNTIHTPSHLPAAAPTPGFSPTKQLSPPAPPMQAPASSPLIPPLFQQQQNPPSSLGLSPTKHSPPRPPQSVPSIADTPV
ncbi:MAG: hypothetical protein LQ347_004626, partial [Umbilicaria vellea]